jgi:DNA-binding MarR family transcriptional regulator
MITKFSKFYEIYSNKALEGTGVRQIEEFAILAIIFNKKNPIKSEVIYDSLLELSSGTNMLIRLIKKGLVIEKADEEDKRVKRLSLTRDGEQVLRKAMQQVLLVESMMVSNLTEEDKQLCIQLLTPVSNSFFNDFQKQKTKTFREIYKGKMKL